MSFFSEKVKKPYQKFMKQQAEEAAIIKATKEKYGAIAEKKRRSERLKEVKAKAKAEVLGTDRAARRQKVKKAAKWIAGAAKQVSKRASKYEKKTRGDVMSMDMGGGSFEFDYGPKKRKKRRSNSVFGDI